MSNNEQSIQSDNERLRQWLVANGKTQVWLAGQLGVRQSSVSEYINHRVPAERVAEVSRITGIPREDLRPDVFA